MPLYEFECPRCDARFEALVDAGTEIVECRECGVKAAERRLSMFATSRQPTAGQRRRLEDKRGVNRDGARKRWKQSMDRARSSGGGDKRRSK